MTTVICESNCIYSENRKCQLGEIAISAYGECDEYEEYDYLTKPEYQSKFWRSCQCTDTKKFNRVKDKGKKIEAFGLIFHTTSNDRYPDNMELIELRTGISCGSYGKLEGRIDKAKELLPQYPDVMSLPIGSR